MIKTVILSMCLTACSVSLSARAQDERAYTEGPVTEEDYIHVEYGHFEEYIDWLNSTWKPTMEATKKAGLIIDYKVFKLTPKSLDQPNIILWITYKNAAATSMGLKGLAAGLLPRSHAHVPCRGVSGHRRSSSLCHPHSR